MNLFRIFAQRKNPDTVRLTKSKSGGWMVKKGLNVLYIGSKENCEVFIQQTMSV